MMSQLPNKKKQKEIQEIQWIREGRVETNLF